MKADVSPMQAALHVAFGLNVPPETVPLRYPRNFPCTPALTRWPCFPVVSHAPGLWPASVTNVPLSWRPTRNVPLPFGLMLHVRLLVSVAQPLPHVPLSVTVIWAEKRVLWPLFLPLPFPPGSASPAAASASAAASNTAVVSSRFIFE